MFRLYVQIFTVSSSKYKGIQLRFFDNHITSALLCSHFPFNPHLHIILRMLAIAPQFPPNQEDRFACVCAL